MKEPEVTNMNKWNELVRRLETVREETVTGILEEAKRSDG